MMRKNIIILSIFKLLIYSSVFSQTTQISNNSLPNIFPSSPEISKFNRFGNQNLSLNKGEVSISFPIFNIKNNDISFDLSFSYNSNGIKVSDIATPLGTSWSIDNIPTISRTVRGLPDENTFFDINVSFLLNKITNGTPSEKLNYKNGIYNREYDTEPDIFQFSIIGESGKFYYSQEKGEFVTIPKSNIKITRVGNIGFKIVDDKGLEYTFESIGETTQDINNGGVSKNAWKVEKITSLKTMNSVNFEYFHRDTFTLKLSNTTNIYYVGGMIIPPSAINSINNPSGLSHFLINQMDIKRIYYDNTQILFNYDTAERLDLKGSKKLNSIEIKTDSTSVKKFVFNHYYPGVVNSPSILSDTEYTGNRLFLESYQEYNNLSTQNLKTSFEYDSVGLPGRLSYAQDLYGYANGAIYTNTSLTPDVATANELSYNSQTANIFFEGANRKINPAFTQAGLLKKIIYPTGGVKEFEYEQNTIYAPEENKKTLVDGEGVVLDLTFNPEYANDPNYTIPTYDETIVDIQGVNCFIKINRNDCSSNQALCGSVKLQGIDPSNQNIIMYLFESMPNYISIPSGRYKFSITQPSYIPADNPEFEGNWAMLNYKSYKYILFPERNEIGPGVRIKSIKEYDFSNQFLYKKVYSYKNENNNFSSGYLNVNSTNCFSKLNDYVYYDVHLNSYGDCVTDHYNSKYFSVYSFDNIDYIDSPRVLYSTITETQISSSNTDNGQTFYEFLKTPTATIGLSLPLVPFIYDSQSYEMLKKQEVFKKANNLLYKKEQTVNNYSRQTYDVSNAFVFDITKQMAFYITGGCQSNGEYPLERIFHIDNFFTYNQYSLKSDKLLLDSIQKNDYFDNGQSISSTKTFAYNTSNLLSSETTTNSKGESLKTDYFYSKDLTPSSIKNEFISKNVISIPLKTQTFKGAQKLSEQETVYAKDATTNNLLLPKTVLASKGTQTLETKITYNSYDDKGNITQYTPEGGISTAVIWGYNQSLPIAKIENATYSQVQQYVATLQSASNNDTLTQNSFSTLRNALPNAMITTYTHKPLVGISTIVDPKGNQTTYTYDSFNRLKEVKDHQNNVLKEHSYNYRP